MVNTADMQMCDIPTTSPVDEGSTRPRILYLTHRVPYPPDRGDRIRTYHSLTSFSSRFDVDLACLADEPLDEVAARVLRKLCRRVAVIPTGGKSRWSRALASLIQGRSVTEGAFQSPVLRDVLLRWTSTTRYETAVASSSGMAPYLKVGSLRSTPVLIDLVDVDSEKWLEYAAASRGPLAWLYRTEGQRLRSLERSLAEWAFSITLISPAEVDDFRQIHPEAPVSVISNGVDLNYFRPGREESAFGCVFVGALDYRPNIDGACWFCQEVWPEIRRRYRQATLSLVGRKPTPAVLRLGQIEGVNVVGQVPDIRPYVAKAAVAVVPLRIARGLQNKVLESLAMGKAVVSSPQALRGVSVETGIHLLSASSPGEWIELVSRLFDSPDERRRLGAEGRRFVECHHQWNRCLEPLMARLEAAIKTPTSGVHNGSELL